jgi:hypothetical protein
MVISGKMKSQEAQLLHEKISGLNAGDKAAIKEIITEAIDSAPVHLFPPADLSSAPISG